ncbi:Type II secretion system protein J (plasmid) [Providencia alcalifaciens]|nr:Type II secretion system protein J [Providencia alcalifaciens]CAG9435712.1 Type II secretion system protein J [Providencia alcalifaciens]CAG9435730.1 Type II secretion system protein J [Providencia alcalifaciens]CAG9435731.1 Type II secretion system protein J [Providencia alcalifaciens]CAG9435955.1 Type II secretion system protein J [Providencia alcalifaciens]
MLEMLLAIAIFSAFSIGAFQVLQSGIQADELSRTKQHRLAELQRAFNQIEQDFTHMLPLHLLGRERPRLETPQLQSDAWDVSFIRNSWQNPLGILHRTELQQVGYRLQHQQLERLSHSYADQPSKVYQESKVLLNDVRGFRLRFYANGKWLESWNNATLLPQGVEVTLIVDDFAQLTRLFLLNEGCE